MNVQPYSFVDQDYIWVAEYADGTKFFEFDPNTKQKNDFYAIRRDSLIRFGLIGHDMKLYFEVFGGFWKINGQLLEIIYRTNEKDYYFTGQPMMYNDIITFKEAESYLNLNAFEEGGRGLSRITQYNVGYKTSMKIDDIKFNFKSILSIPFNRPVYMNIRLVSSKKLDGELVIRKNGMEVERVKAPLKRGVGGEFNWVVR